MLNLPQTITKNDGSTVVYVYSAGGNKLRKLYTAGGITTTTEYDNGIEYDNSTTNVAFIQTEEGRARHSGTTYTYEYDLKDHLGNTRVTLTPDPNDPTQQTAKILQENDYYAFGYGIQSLQQSVPSPKNEYLYNHKELQEETGLYDYGARFYDPVIGRWTSVDKLAEHDDQIDKSPYAYVWDNPIVHDDPDGNCPICIPIIVAAVEALTTEQVVGGLIFVAGGTYITSKIIDHSSNRSVFDRPVFSNDNTRITNSIPKITPSIVKNNKSDTKIDSQTSKKKDNTYDRVNPRKSTKEQVKANQPRNDAGEMLDPNTGQVIDENSMDLGHIYGQEWRTRKKMHQENGSTRKQVIEAENDPSLYQYEDRKSNRSHKNEKKQTNGSQ